MSILQCKGVNYEHYKSAILWGELSDKIYIFVHGKMSNKESAHGFATTFTITTFEPMERYEFDIDNNNICGHWTGIFSKTNDNKTEISFTENITPKKWIMKPFVGIYLRKQQAVYISDLRKALERK